MRFVRLVTVVGFSVACSDAPTPALPSTGCEGEYSTYEPGMSVETDRSSYTVSLVSALPDPPDEGVNDWVLAIEDGSGPIQGASVIVEPWMPAHGHGVSPPTYIGAAGENPGEYVIPPFDLIMPGVWEFRINVNKNMVSDNAAFTFCAEG